jgi:transcriptional regulator
MYRPSYSIIQDEAVCWQLMREFNFALLITAPDGVPFATPVPFSILEGERKIQTHIAKANPQWQHIDQNIDQDIDQKEVLIVFQGEHDVPTWAYATVHAYATSRVLDFAETRTQIADLMQHHDHASDMENLPADYLNSVQKGVVGLEFTITRLEGKFKMLQHEKMPDRARVMDTLEGGDEQAKAVAARMQGLLQK